MIPYVLTFSVLLIFVRSPSSISIKMFEPNVDSSCKTTHQQHLQSSEFAISFSDSRNPKTNKAATASTLPSTISTSTSHDNPASVFLVRSFSLCLFISWDRSCRCQRSRQDHHFPDVDQRSPTHIGRDHHRWQRHPQISTHRPLSFVLYLSECRSETSRSASVHSSTGSCPTSRSTKRSRSSPGQRETDDVHAHMKRFRVIRLKGLKWSIIDQLTRDMIDLFGLEAYHRRSIYKLR